MTNTGNNGILEKVYKKRDEIVSRNIVGETILVPVKGKLADMQKIFSLNPAAEFIWEEIDGRKDVKEIRDKIIKRFDVDASRADSDIREFIKDLLGSDLIAEIK
jgi:hypothetical protein